MSTKPRIIKDFDTLDPVIREQIKLVYPYGFFKALIQYTDVNGTLRSALPFETDEKYYLVRMTISEAKGISREDDDFDDDGILKDDVRDDYDDKYGDLDHIDAPMD